MGNHTDATVFKQGGLVVVIKNNRDISKFPDSHISIGRSNYFFDTSR